METQNIVSEDHRLSAYIDDIKLDFRKTSETPIFPAAVTEKREK